MSSVKMMVEINPAREDLKGTSLTCPFTKWTINSGKQERTPDVHSARILEWLRLKVLVPTAENGDISDRFGELLEGDPEAFTLEQATTMAKRINQSEGRGVITMRDSGGNGTDRDTLIKDIVSWRAGTLNIEDKGEVDVYDAMNSKDAIAHVATLDSIEALQALGSKEADAKDRTTVLKAIDARVEALEALAPPAGEGDGGNGGNE